MSLFGASQRHPAVRFPEVGDGIEGTVAAEPQEYSVREFGTNEIVYNKDGTVKKGVRVVLDTPEGKRTLWAQGRVFYAVVRAISDSGAPDIEVGGLLAVKRTADGDPKPGARPPHNYDARYAPPAVSHDPEDTGPPF